MPIGERLMGPPGARATVYAIGLINASAFALDPAGRLWIATAAYADQGTDAVYLVRKAGSTPVKVISGLKTPLGLLWSGDTFYVSSRGQVEAYRGLQGTTFAEKRAVVTFPAGVGELNNIARAPDGRLELGISAPCDHCAPASPWSGTIVSFHPDGSDLRIDARGIRAPFGLAFLPGTGDLLVSMNQRDDLGARTPGDWLGVVKQGQNWGFPDCYGQGGVACAGTPTPLAVLDAHAAAGGVAIVGDGALVAEWARGIVQRVSLSTHAVSPWLSGLKNPLAVLVVSGGSVLVGDWKTGIVYRIGKP